MIDVALARDLRTAGLRWHPTPGDRFVIVGDEFGDEVFTISEMTIEAHDYSGTTVLGFNGTTEWALDSVQADDSLWLPREDQLRSLLAPVFVSLTKQGDEYRVKTNDGAHTDLVAENAYGAALLAYITASLHLDENEVDLASADNSGGAIDTDDLSRDEPPA